MRPTLEKPVTIGDIARLTHRPRSTVRFQLLEMMRKDAQGDWFARVGRVYKFTLSRMRRRFPHMFSTTYATSIEHEELVERVVRVEESCIELKTRQNALSSSVRQLRRTTTSKVSTA
jgi:hypothetical protein